MAKAKVKAPSCLPDGPDWTFALLDDYLAEISRVAAHYKLDTYPNQIEVITAEQMMDAYSSVGMPIGYHHWSYGKKFIQTEQNYKRGNMGLAYEIVINSNPCIAYLMEENTITMQALVMAHASFGHNSFFKNNYLFKTWTDAGSIIDYLVFARHYINQCEEKYGVSEVEDILDSCHALMNYGVDRYKRPQKISLDEEQKRQQEREAYLQSQVNHLWRTIPSKAETERENINRFPSEPQENILYFIEKNAPLLKPWQREVVRIVRKISQYFYPQKQTQVMNEGWASYWHSRLLREADFLPSATYVDCMKTHSDVVSPYAGDQQIALKLNPYHVGYVMWEHIIADAGVARAREIMAQEDDFGFVRNYLNRELADKMKLFSYSARHDGEITVADNNLDDLHENILAPKFNFGAPRVVVDELQKDGTLILKQESRIDGRGLELERARKVLDYIASIWRRPVKLLTLDAGDNEVWLTPGAT